MPDENAEADSENYEEDVSSSSEEDEFHETDAGKLGQEEESKDE